MKLRKYFILIAFAQWLKTGQTMLFVAVGIVFSFLENKSGVERQPTAASFPRAGWAKESALNALQFCEVTQL